MAQKENTEVEQKNYRKEIQKLTFSVLDLRQSESSTIVSIETNSFIINTIRLVLPVN